MQLFLIFKFVFVNIDILRIQVEIFYKIKQTVYEYLILYEWDNSIDKANRTLGANVCKINQSYGSCHILPKSLITS